MNRDGCVVPVQIQSLPQNIHVLFKMAPQKLLGIVHSGVNHCTDTLQKFTQVVYCDYILINAWWIFLTMYRLHKLIIVVLIYVDFFMFGFFTAEMNNDH